MNKMFIFSFLVVLTFVGGEATTTFIENVIEHAINSELNEGLSSPCIKYIGDHNVEINGTVFGMDETAELQLTNMAALLCGIGSIGGDIVKVKDLKDFDNGTLLIQVEQTNKLTFASGAKLNTSLFQHDYPLVSFSAQANSSVTMQITIVDECEIDYTNIDVPPALNHFSTDRIFGQDLADAAVLNAVSASESLKDVFINNYKEALKNIIEGLNICKRLTGLIN